MPTLSSAKCKPSSRVQVEGVQSAKSKKLTNHFKVKLGFTLIELLVVLGILASTVGAALLLLTSVLRGTNQGNVTAEVKQNGQVVLDSLEKQIRGALDARLLSSAERPNGSLNALVVTLASGGYLYVACFDSVPGSANGWIGTAASFSATSPSIGLYQTLTNRDNIAGVDVVCGPCPPTCTFGVILASSGSLNPPIVKVGFTVNQGVKAPSRQDFLANARFETTISLRRY